MVNNVVLVGRLTKDAVLRRTQNGTSTASFTVACDKRDKNGNQSADFINCVCWGKIAENLVQYTSKGSLVGVEGRIQTRNYDDQSGKKVYVTEVLANSVQFLSFKGNNAQEQSTTNASSFNQQMHQDVNDSFAQQFNNLGLEQKDMQVSGEDLPF